MISYKAQMTKKVKNIENSSYLTEMMYKTHQQQVSRSIHIHTTTSLTK